LRVFRVIQLKPDGPLEPGLVEIGPDKNQGWVLILGDGKIYGADDRGDRCVIKAQPDWEVLSSSFFEEVINPTPVISDGAIYLRAESRLFCFSSG